jgi:hypothetical protein
MSRVTFFYQECPVCGRSLRVAVRYFGREMSCSHCHGQFIAGRQTNTEPSPPQPHAVGSDGLLTPAPVGAPQLGEA